MNIFAYFDKRRDSALKLLSGALIPMLFIGMVVSKDIPTGILSILISIFIIKLVDSLSKDKRFMKNKAYILFASFSCIYFSFTLYFNFIKNSYFQLGVLTIFLGVLFYIYNANKKVNERIKENIEFKKDSNSFYDDFDISFLGPEAIDSLNYINKKRNLVLENFLSNSKATITIEDYLYFKIHLVTEVEKLIDDNSKGNISDLEFRSKLILIQSNITIYHYNNIVKHAV